MIMKKIIFSPKYRYRPWCQSSFFSFRSTRCQGVGAWNS